MSSHTLRVVCAILRDEDGRVLAARRPAGKAQAGKWEFPGGKIEAGESPREALQRELWEELGIEPEIGPEWPPVEHLGERITIVLLPLEASAPGQEPVAHEHDELRWLAPGAPEWFALDWAEADLPIVRELALCPKPGGAY